MRQLEHETVTPESVAQLLTAGRLDDLAEALAAALVFSSSRPWQLHRPGVDQLTIAPLDAGFRAEGTVASLHLTADFQPAPDGLAITLTWQNRSDSPQRDLVVGLDVAGSSQGLVTIPHVIHHDNPGADTDATVPRVGRGGFVTEIHRLPIPVAVTQSAEGDTCSLLFEPVPRLDAAGEVGYGSLGATQHTDGSTTIHAWSGVTMFDGQPEINYVHKAQTAPTGTGYLNLEPGGDWTMTLHLVLGQQPYGQGFREAVRLGRRTFSDGWEPVSSRSFPRTIELKTQALDARFFADGDASGYVKFPAWGEPRTRVGHYAQREFLYGWTGQALRLAWCDARLGRAEGQEWRRERARRVTDFYVGSSGTPTPGLRFNTYRHDDDTWLGVGRAGRNLISARAYGETLIDLADLVAELGSAAGDSVDAWVAALNEAADFLATTRTTDGIVPLGWEPDGTPVSDLTNAAGMACASALVRIAEVTGSERHRRTAEDLAEAYHRSYGSYVTPLAYATLDATCEDKESGMLYLELLHHLHRTTGREAYLERAEPLMDWLLTWVFHWDVEFSDGAQLARAGFHTTGWPGVSIQNHHLDVFFPAFHFWYFASERGDTALADWSMRVLTAMGQGICARPGEWGFDVVGEQGEAFFQTGWQQHGRANTWNPSWVIAAPLSELLRLEAAGGFDPEESS